jgi:hypothetical protein
VQAGTDTLAALVARTIAAAKLKVKVKAPLPRASCGTTTERNSVTQEEAEEDGLNPLLRDDAPD